MHDPLDARDMTIDLFEYMRNRGFAYEPLLEDSARKLAESNDQTGLWRIHSALQTVCQVQEAAHQTVEPDDLDGILSRFASQLDERDSDWIGSQEYSDKVNAAWLGRCIACCMGKPIECMSKESIRRYLKAINVWPLRGYIPPSDVVPDGVEGLNTSSTVATEGNINGMPRDDDTDYTILGLHMLEQYGSGLSTKDVADSWMTLLPFCQTYTAERATYRNLVAGMPADHAGGERNPYREWIGALIRADIYGYVYPTSPLKAAKTAYQDAYLSHRGNGIYGEMWAAALIALAFTSETIEQAVRASIGYTPQGSMLQETITHILSMYDDGDDMETALQWIDNRFSEHSWVHTLNNAAIITMSLLWNSDDFTAAAGTAVQSGYDTDSAAATVGSIMGARLGMKGIPSRLSEPLHDRIHSAVHGYDGSSISGLADRTIRLAHKLNGLGDLN